MVSSTPRPSLPTKKARYPFYRRLGGPQGRYGREENLVPTGIRSRTVQPDSSVAIPTELSGPHISLIVFVMSLFLLLLDNQNVFFLCSFPTKVYVGVQSVR